MSGVACHHVPWTTHMVKRRQTWHAIIVLGLQTRSNDVKCGMSSSCLDNTHDWTTYGVACHHRLWTTHTVERRWPWHDIIALGMHTWSDDIGRAMLSSHLENTHDRTTSSVACLHDPLVAHTVGQHQSLNARITLGQHKW